MFHFILLRYPKTSTKHFVYGTGIIKICGIISTTELFSLTDEEGGDR